MVAMSSKEVGIGNFILRSLWYSSVLYLLLHICEQVNNILAVWNSDIQEGNFIDVCLATA
ncbi:hypothetical protein DAPPUDRAFT_253494 [Daphnia pulex]|uniref:Uncharacterized protein n=1 Tax=Daphnia pulex TaxID=6669 RepID=E9H4Z0_DAPPU|nr:hypothetical protein DAPPUDRAFT_253494 [Daphnia pulex]|eukprot:EFX73230.1 hypothetical protein DAPPUDRAFT_253494 [Daphnia pulex]